MNSTSCIFCDSTGFNDSCITHECNAFLLQQRGKGKGKKVAEADNEILPLDEVAAWLVLRHGSIDRQQKRKPLCMGVITAGSKFPASPGDLRASRQDTGHADPDIASPGWFSAFNQRRQEKVYAEPVLLQLPFRCHVLHGPCAGLPGVTVRPSLQQITLLN